jgi:hypothetical protein
MGHPSEMLYSQAGGHDKEFKSRYDEDKLEGQELHYPGSTFLVNLCKPLCQRLIALYQSAINLFDNAIPLQKTFKVKWMSSNLD